MASETQKNHKSAPEAAAGVRRRGLLRFGTLLTAFTGASAISALGASSAHAGPGDKNPPTSYVPIAEKGVASGVATLDLESKIPPAQLPDLSATFVPKWKANTAYLAGDKVLSPGGDVVSAKVDFTSGASYNAANWNLSPTYALPASVTPRWQPNTAYTYLQQIISPNNDVVSAKNNFTSGATYDPTKWNLSPSYAAQTANGDVAASGTYIGKGLSIGGTGNARMPNNLFATINGSLLNAANPGDKVGLQNSVTFKGGFTNEARYGVNNAGFLFGANDFIISGSTAGDLAGVTDFYGRLVEAHAQAPGTNLNVLKALQVESHLEPSATGGHIGTLYGVHILAPRNGGTIDLAYGLRIDSPVLAATNWALFIGGAAKSYFGGDVEMDPASNIQRFFDAKYGGFRGVTVTIGNPGTTSCGRLTIKAQSDSDVVAAFQGRGGQSGDIAQFGNDTIVRTRFDKNGRLAMANPNAPADADIRPGEIVFYIDATSGAMKLKLKAKDAGGTVRTGEVTLA